MNAVAALTDQELQNMSAVERFSRLTVGEPPADDKDFECAAMLAYARELLVHENYKNALFLRWRTRIEPGQKEELRASYEYLAQCARLAATFVIVPTPAPKTEEVERRLRMYFAERYPRPFVRQMLAHNKTWRANMEFYSRLEGYLDGQLWLTDLVFPIINFAN